MNNTNACKQVNPVLFTFSLSLCSICPCYIIYDIPHRSNTFFVSKRIYHMLLAKTCYFLQVNKTHKSLRVKATFNSHKIQSCTMKPLNIFVTACVKKLNSNMLSSSNLAWIALRKVLQDIDYFMVKTYQQNTVPNVILTFLRHFFSKTGKHLRFSST